MYKKDKKFNKKKLKASDLVGFVNQDSFFSISVNMWISREEGDFQVKGYWGCAAEWSHIFTTGLTIMGLH